MRAAGLLCTLLQTIPYTAAGVLQPERLSLTLKAGSRSFRLDGEGKVRDVILPETLAMKEQLRQIDGVTEVTWLDDSVSVLQPLETVDRKLVETYYQDDSALYSLVIAEDKRVQAIEDIRALIGDGNAVTGAAASTADATTSTVTQIMKIAIVAVIFVLCILLLTTTSGLEPFIVLGSMGWPLSSTAAAT